MESMKEFLGDLAKQVWVLIGLFSAWLVLTGPAKVIVGYAILAGIVIWALTVRLRNPQNKPRQ